MIKCPHCGKQVVGEDFVTGLCTHCHQRLTVDEEGSIVGPSRKFFDKQLKDSSQRDASGDLPIRIGATHADLDAAAIEESGIAATVMSEDLMSDAEESISSDDSGGATAVSVDETDDAPVDDAATIASRAMESPPAPDTRYATANADLESSEIAATYISDDIPEDILKTEQHDEATEGLKTLLTDESEQSPLKSDDLEVHLRTFVVETAATADMGDGDKTFISDEAPEGLMKTVQSLWGSLDEAVPSHPDLPRPNSPTVAGPQRKVTQPTKQTLVIKTKSFSDVVPRGAGAPRIREDDPEYELLKVLGEGGMGVVYDARQTSIDRNVAVKMLKAKSADNEKQRAKFLAEAVVTGELDHPNIVPIYDVGANSEGALFYSMKKVQGTPWLKVIKQKSLPENLEILMKIADAVGFAHARGVVHRDLKPENVMLGEFGEVLVMDWGLAQPSKAFRKSSSITETNTMGGTPAYMAPEMTTGPIDRIGPASDVYLLGAMLYEILTGTPPHVAKNAMKCLMAAARNEIAPTEKKGELVDIAMRAMETDPADRFPDVKSFQSAIRDYQSHSESVLLSEHASHDLTKARASDDYEGYSRSVFGYQQAIELWSGNNAAVTGLAGAKLAYAESAFRKGDLDLSLSLLDKDNPGHTGLRAQLLEAQQERKAKIRRLVLLKRLAAGLAASVFVLVIGASILINQQKERALESEAQAKISERKAIASEAIARTAESEAIASEAKAKVSEREAREAERIAKVSERLAMEAKNAEEYQAYIARIGLAASQIEKNAFDAARKTLNDCRPTDPQDRDLRNWEWGRLDHLCGQSVKIYPTDQPLEALAVTRQGDRFATGGSNGRVQIWDRTSEKAVTLNANFRSVNALAFSPDGTSLAIGCSHPDGYLQIWDTQSLQRRHQDQFSGHTASVTCVTYSSHGESILTSSSDKSVRLWDVASGELKQSFFDQTGTVWSAAFSPDESQIVTAGQDSRAIVYDLSGHTKPKKFHGHDKSPVYSAVFTRDGQSVISAGQDGRILIWKPDEIQPYNFDALKEVVASGDTKKTHPIIPPPKYQEFIASESDLTSKPVRSLAMTADGHHLISSGDDNTIRIWNVVTRVLEKQIRGHGSIVRSALVLSNGKRLLSASDDKTVREWIIEGFTEVRTLFEGHVDAVLSAAYSPDQRLIVTSSGDRSARIWNTVSGKLEHEFGKDDQSFDASEHGAVRPKNEFREGHLFLVSSAIFFPDGRQLLTAAADNTARVWDVERGGQSLLLENTGRAAAIAISDNLKWIATGGGKLSGTDNQSESIWTAQLWNAVTGEQIKTLASSEGHKWEVTAVRFSPDSRLLATGDIMGHVRLWDLETGNVVAKLDGHARYKISAILFLDGGTRLATACFDNTVMQWDLRSGTAIKSLTLAHPDSVLAMQVVPGTTQLVTSSTEQKSRSNGRVGPVGTLRLWDAETGTLLLKSIPFNGTAHAISISAAGDRVIAANSETGNVLAWNLKSEQHSMSALLQNPSKSDLRSTVLHPDGKHVVTIGGSDALLWDLTDAHKPVLIKSFSQHLTVASARFSPDGKLIATGGLDKNARIWDIQTKRVIRKLEGEQGHKGRVNSTVFSSDSTHLLTSSNDGTVKLWNIQTGDVVFTLINRATDADDPVAVHAATFSQDGNWIATASEDGQARIWQVSTRECVKTLTGHQAGVVCVEFTTDGRKIVTGSKDKTARLWDVATGTEELIFEGHTEGVTSVAVSHDMLRVLTGSTDDSAKLWDAKVAENPLTSSPTPVTNVSNSTGSQLRRATEILTLTRHKNDVTSVAFSPDGLQILTGSLDRTAVIWLARDWRQHDDSTQDAVARMMHNPGLSDTESHRNSDTRRANQ